MAAVAVDGSASVSLPRQGLATYTTASDTTSKRLVSPCSKAGGWLHELSLL